ncbi:MAG: PEGA domain-containing protein [bacterium]
MRKELIFNLTFGLVNVLVMVIVIVFARGYNYNPVTNKLEKQGTLVVESEPSGSGVYLDDEYIGNTPVQKTSIKPGSYSLSIKQNGYYDLSTNIEIIDNYVTKKYYKLINNNQQLVPITAANVISQTLSENGNYLISLEKTENKASLSYISFDKNAINIALGQENAYSSKVIDSSLALPSQDLNISVSKDGTQGIISSSDLTTLLYFKTQQNFSPIDIKKILGFTPDKIIFNKYNNIIIKRNNDYYYFDINTNSLTLKASFNESQKPIINSGIYLIENNKLKVYTNSSTLNDTIQFALPVIIPASEINSGMVYVDEDSEGNIFVSTKSAGSFGINKTGGIINITSNKQFTKNVTHSENDIYISNDKSELLNINFTISTTVLVSNLPGEEPRFARNRDFIIIPDYQQKTLKAYDTNFKLIRTIELGLGPTEELNQMYLNQFDEIIIRSKDTLTSNSITYKLVF